MQKTKVVVTLPNRGSYQQEQAQVARQTAHKLGVELEVLFTENDINAQGKQLLDLIRQGGSSKPDVILVEPFSGTGFIRAAELAVSAGIGWVVLCDIDYIEELRKQARAPVFAVMRDDAEIGRLQAKQIAALLPDGGNLLHVQGPVATSAAQLRTEGFMGTKSPRIQTRPLRSAWSMEEAYRVMADWIQRPSSRLTPVDGICCHSDALAYGVRKAIEEKTSGPAKDRWLHLPITGVDGLAKEGQAWVRQGLLTATIGLPITTGIALQLYVEAAASGIQPAPRTVLTSGSYPSLDQLTHPRRATG